MNPLLSADQARVGAVLARALPRDDAFPPRLHAAMRYACTGGKRLRALLVYASARSLGLPLEQVDSAAVAVELIHAYSLVHDDLPAMDNDDLRRGQPTVHRAYDEATAILVGDALQALAFEVIADDPVLSPVARAAMVTCLARAGGSRGMAGGQALDLEAERAGQPLDITALEDLHRRKTGALIEASLHLPVLARGQADDDISRALARCGEALGLGYQIQDDVLDVSASSDQLGKTPGKDAAAGKSTYVSVLGLPTAQRLAAETFERAHAALGERPEHDRLRNLLNWIEGRAH